MAYKCYACGHIFEDGEERTWTEPHGERMVGCQICGGAFGETERCRICKSEHLEDELTDGVCDECVDEYRNDFATCYNLFVGEKAEIKINPVLAFLLDDADIEQILKEHICKRLHDIDCSPFIDENKEWFVEKLLKEVNKNENAKG